MWEGEMNESEYFRTASVTFTNLISVKWLLPEHHGKTANALAGEALERMKLRTPNPLMTNKQEAMLFADVTEEFMVNEARWLFRVMWRVSVEAQFDR